MGQLIVTGNLQGGPPIAGDGTFPASQFNTPLRLSQSPKLWQSASGVLTRLLSNAVVFTVLPAVGAAGDVPRANFLYARADGAYQLRLTQDDGAGGTTVQTLQCQGLFMAEFPDARALVQVEVAATGKLEYFASG